MNDDAPDASGDREADEAQADAANASGDRYDPTGEAAIWSKASALVDAMRNPRQSDDWNAALDQAARELDNEARGIRQAVGGMYYRVTTGSTYTPLHDS